MVQACYLELSLELELLDDELDDELEELESLELVSVLVVFLPPPLRRPRFACRAWRAGSAAWPAW